MYKRIIKVTNESGLHARPGAMFVDKAKTFQSAIKISRLDKPEKVVNAKSIVLVLSVGIKKNAEVEIQAEGADEKEAVDTLVEMIESGLGE